MPKVSSRYSVKGLPYQYYGGPSSVMFDYGSGIPPSSAAASLVAEETDARVTVAVAAITDIRLLYTITIYKLIDAN